MEATARTVDSAGRTVIFSGLTVAISLGGLLVFEAPIMKAIGSAGLSVVLFAILVAVTLVPALAALGARRLLRKGTEQAPEHVVSHVWPPGSTIAPSPSSWACWPSWSSWRCPPWACA